MEAPHHSALCFLCDCILSAAGAHACPHMATPEGPGTWTLSALNTRATCSPLLVKTYNIPQREPSTYYAPDTVLREEL